MGKLDSSFYAATGRSPREKQFDQLFEEMCRDLRVKASRLCKREGSPMWATGDLVSALFVRLRKHPTYSLEVAQRSKLEFMYVATTAMRHVLTDAARKVGPRPHQVVTMSKADRPLEVKLTTEQLIDLDTALKVLEEHHPRQAAMITMKFYGGMSVKEMQEVWDVSDATVERDLKESVKFLHALLGDPRR